MYRIARLNSYRPSVERLEARQLLAVDAAPFVATRDLMFESTTPIQVAGSAIEEIVVSLPGDQSVLLKLEDMPSDFHSVVQVEVEYPNGQRVPLEAFPAGREVYFETLRTDSAGEFRFSLENKSESNLSLSAVLMRNALFEAETSDQTNNALPSAFDLDPYFVSASDSLNASLVNVYGTFERAPATTLLEASFEDGQLPASWDVESSYESGRVQLVSDTNGTRLRMDATSADPDNDEFIDGIVYYDPQTGQIRLEASRPFTALTIISRSGIFGGQRPAFLDGDFDVFRSDKLFRLDHRGVQSLDFGLVAPPGLSYEFLRNDIRFETAVLGGGRGSLVGNWQLNGLERGGPVKNSITMHVAGATVGESVLRFTYQSRDSIGGRTVPSSFSGSAAGQFVAVSNDGERWFTESLPATGDESMPVELDLFSFARDHRDLNLHGPLYVRIQQSTIGDPMFVEDLTVTSEPRTDWYKFTASGGDLITFDGRFDPGELQVYGPDGSPLTTSEYFRIPEEFGTSAEFSVAALGRDGAYNLAIRKNLADRGDEDWLLQTSGTLNVIRYFEQTSDIDDREFDIEFRHPTPERLTVRAFSVDSDPASADTPLRLASFSPFGTNADGSITITEPDDEPSIVVPDADGHVLLTYDLGGTTTPQKLSYEFGQTPPEASTSLTIDFVQPVWTREIDPADFTWTGPAILDASMSDGGTMTLRFADSLGAANNTLSIPAGYFARLASDDQDPSLSVTVDSKPIQILESSIQAGDVMASGPTSFTVRYSESPFGRPQIWSESSQEYLSDRGWLAKATRESDGSTTVRYTLSIDEPGSYSMHFSSVRDESGNSSDAEIDFTVDATLPRLLDHYWRAGSASFTRDALRPSLTGEAPSVYLQTLVVGETLVGEFRGHPELVREVKLLSPSGAMQLATNDDQADQFAFEFQAVEDGMHRIEILGESGGYVQLYLGRDVARIADSKPLNNQLETAVDLTPLLEAHPVAEDANAYVVDLLKQQHEEDTEWYSVTVQPGESFAVTGYRIKGSGGSRWLTVYRDGQEISKYSGSFRAEQHTEPTTYYVRVLDDHDLYSMTLAKNVSLNLTYELRDLSRLPTEELPSFWRYFGDADGSYASPRSFSTFLKAGERLNVSALLNRSSTGTARISFLDAERHVLASNTVGAESTSLDYTAAESGYVVVRLEQLTGITRLVLQSEIVSNDASNAIWGDLDASGVVDMNDVRLLERAATSRSQLAALDLTGDARVDTQDMAVLVQQAGTIVGDINFDGRFDQLDLAIVAMNFEQPWLPVTWFDGDVDLNGRIDSEDLIKMFQSGDFEV